MNSQTRFFKHFTNYSISKRLTFFNMTTWKCDAFPVCIYSILNQNFITIIHHTHIGHCYYFCSGHMFTSPNSNLFSRPLEEKETIYMVYKFPAISTQFI